MWRSSSKQYKECDKATQRTTMKRSFYWHVFFIKYVITVIVRDEVVNQGLAGRLKLNS